MLFEQPPTPEEIRQARKEAGLTQTECGALVHVKGFRAWQKWEAGDCRMPLAAWELFNAKLGNVKIKVIRR